MLFYEDSSNQQYLSIFKLNVQTQVYFFKLGSLSLIGTYMQ